MYMYISIYTYISAYTTYIDMFMGLFLTDEVPSR